MVFDWMYATSSVLAMVLVAFGLASFWIAAAAAVMGKWWAGVLGVLYILLVIFVICGFAGGAS